MIEYQKISGKNIVTYDKYEFPLNGTGISVIRGKNRAGKSLSCSIIGNLLFASPPMNRGAKRGSAKDLHAKGSEICLQAKINDASWKMYQFSKGASVGYKLVKDGKNLKFRTIALAKERIEKLIPHNEDQFYSLQYLLAARGHVLQQGKPAERRDFFESVFDLSIFDKIQKRLAEKYSSIRHELSALDTIKEQHDNVQDSYVDLGKVKIQLNKFSKSYEILERKTSKRSKLLSKLSLFCSLAEDLVDTKSTADQLRESLERLQRDLSVLVEREATARELLGHVKAAKQNKAVRKKLLEDLKSLKVYKNGDLSELKKRHAMLVKAKKKLEKDIESVYLKEAAEGLLKSAKQVLGAYEEVNKKVLSGKYCQGIIEKQKNKAAGYVTATIESLSQNSNKISRLSAKHLSECPTCGQQLDEKEMYKVLSDSQDKIEKLQVLDQWFDMKAQVEQRERELEPYREIESNKKLTTEKLEGLKKQIKETVKLYKGTKKYLEVKRHLKTVPKMDNKEKAIDLPPLLEKIANLQSTKSQLENDLRIKKKLDKSGLSKLDLKKAIARKKQLSSDLEYDTNKLRSANDKIQSLKAQLAAGSVTNAQISSLEKELNSLKERTKHATIYEALLMAYGAKGLRIERVKALAKLFEDNLNKYQSVIFGEPTSFKINVDKNKFDIIVTRSGKSSEVYYLSGSENRCFQLLCLISLLPFVPAKLRSNVVILDEMEAMMDDTSRLIFTNDFLPKLLTVVPHIVVITPHSERSMPIAHATEYLVKKVKGVSTLEKVGTNV